MCKCKWFTNRASPLLDEAIHHSGVRVSAGTQNCFLGVQHLLFTVCGSGAKNFEHKIWTWKCGVQTIFQRTTGDALTLDLHAIQGWLLTLTCATLVITTFLKPSFLLDCRNGWKSDDVIIETCSTYWIMDSGNHGRWIEKTTWCKSFDDQKMDKMHNPSFSIFWTIVSTMAQSRKAKKHQTPFRIRL
jgi:hypothetical protein